MFSWYRVFNLDDFLESGLVSFEASILLTGGSETGEKSVLITKGEKVSVLIDETMLSINLNGKNPFRFGERAVFLDDSRDVWVGLYAD